MNKETITKENYLAAAMAYLLPSCENGTYSSAGIIGEIGEVCSLIAKAKRKECEVDKQAAMLEVGDCMWFLALYCHLYERDFTDFIDEKDNFKIRFSLEFEDNAGEIDKCSFDLAQFKRDNKLDLTECLQANIAKLADRKSRGVIIGDGDYR